MGATLDSALSDMSLSDIVQALIILKPGYQNFRAEDLKKGLEKAARTYTELGKIFDHYTTGDGTAPPETIEGFDLALDNACNVGLVCEDPHFYHLSFYHIRKPNKPLLTKLLEEDYGRNILEGLKPLAEIAWH